MRAAFDHLTKTQNHLRLLEGGRRGALATRAVVSSPLPSSVGPSSVTAHPLASGDYVVSMGAVARPPTP